MSVPIEGEIYNINGGERVYWVDQDKGRFIVDMNIFNGVFGGGHPTSRDSHPPGSLGQDVTTGSYLVRGFDDPTVYLFDLNDGINWVVREVPTPNTLNTYNLHGPVVRMGDAMLATLKRGLP